MRVSVFAGELTETGYPTATQLMEKRQSSQLSLNMSSAQLIHREVRKKKELELGLQGDSEVVS